MSKINILEQITASDALAILNKLANEDKGIKTIIEKIATEYLSDVNLEDIAEEVFSELDSLYVEDLWDSSGDRSDGYIEPHERAMEMIEETIEPFMDEIKKYRKTKMFQEEKTYCMGILKGIYKYEKEASSEFCDWATDMPGEVFTSVLREWKKNNKNTDDLKEMESFIKKNCGEWV